MEVGDSYSLAITGADPDGKDSRGWTPLMHAIDAHSAAAPREQVVRVLLSRGAAVDVWGDDLLGPLDLARAKAADAVKAEGKGEGKAEGAGATDLRV